MRSAVLSKHSVHYVAMNSEPGFSVRMICDVGEGKGIQRVTVTRNGQTGPATVIVFHKIVFIKGNAFTMRVFFGFSPKQANRFGGRWIFVSNTHPSYEAFADGATYTTFTAGLFPATQLSLVHAGSLIGVRGTAQQGPGTVVETVFAPAQGQPLPVKQTTRFPGHPGTDRSKMSRWNEAVHVTVPAKALPIEVVTG